MRGTTFAYVNCAYPVPDPGHRSPCFTIVRSGPLTPCHRPVQFLWLGTSLYKVVRMLLLLSLVVVDLPPFLPSRFSQSWSSSAPSFWVRRLKISTCGAEPFGLRPFRGVFLPSLSICCCCCCYLISTILPISHQSGQVSPQTCCWRSRVHFGARRVVILWCGCSAKGQQWDAGLRQTERQKC